MANTPIGPSVRQPLHYPTSRCIQQRASRSDTAWTAAAAIDPVRSSFRLIRPALSCRASSSSLYYEAGGRCQVEGWIIGVDWVLVIAICNNEESQCRGFSNGGVLWDG